MLGKRRIRKSCEKPHLGLPLRHQTPFGLGATLPHAYATLPSCLCPTMCWPWPCHWSSDLPHLRICLVSTGFLSASGQHHKTCRALLLQALCLHTWSGRSASLPVLWPPSAPKFLSLVKQPPHAALWIAREKQPCWKFCICTWFMDCFSSLMKYSDLQKLEMYVTHS